MSLEDAAAFAREVHQRDGRVVFTNGVFDLLHPGHVRYLREARGLGEALIIGVNADQSVRANKGENRPVNRAADRVEILLALSFVDAVVVFDEDTPHRVITAIQPDVLVKGGDYGLDEIHGREEVEGAGGRVIALPLVEGASTSSIIERIKTRC